MNDAMKIIETTVRLKFDPIEVRGNGRYSNGQKTRPFTATGVEAVATPDGLVECHWLGTRANGDAVRDWFFSNDSALTEMRRTAVLAARCASHSACLTPRVES